MRPFAQTQVKNLFEIKSAVKINRVALHVTKP